MIHLITIAFDFCIPIYIIYEIVKSWCDKWVYLGHTEITHRDPITKAVWFKKTIHYYAKGKYWKKRKVTWEKHITDDFIVKEHNFYQTEIIPWIHGNAVFAGIRNPSDALKTYVRIIHKIYWSDSNKCWRHIVPGLLTDD